MLERLARWTYRHRWWTLLFWIVALAAAIIGLTWSLGRIAMASALRMGED
jgi:uncharacterized membrane protein YdfJ with MMPL/SSD domain